MSYTEFETYKEWRDEDNLLHRIDGPAFINRYGDEQWEYHGKMHRIDGPAVIWRRFPQIEYRYFVNGIDITNEVIAWMKEHNISYPFDEDTILLFKLRFA